MKRTRWILCQQVFLYSLFYRLSMSSPFFHSLESSISFNKLHFSLLHSAWVWEYWRWAFDTFCANNRRKKWRWLEALVCFEGIRSMQSWPDFFEKVKPRPKGWRAVAVSTPFSCILWSWVWYLASHMVWSLVGIILKYRTRNMPEHSSVQSQNKAQKKTNTEDLKDV